MNQSQQKTHSVTSGLFWRFGERIITQGVTFIVSLVLARLLMPEDYGAIAIILIFIDIASTFVVSGLSTALIQKKEITPLEISTVFYCNLGLSVILYWVLFFCAPLIAHAYSLPILIPTTRVFALQLPVSAFQSIQTALISRELNFKKLFLGTIVGTICSAAIGILMALKGFGVWALVAQSLTCTIISSLILTIVVRWHPIRQFSFRVAKPLIQFGWKILVADLVAAISNQFSSLIIGAKYTTADLAYYTKGKQLPQIIRTNLYNTLISVLFPAMTHVNSNLEQLKAFSKKSLRILCYVTCPLMIGLMAVSHNLVLVLYTEKWIQMTPFMSIICIECLLAIPPTIFLQALKAIGKSDVMLKLEFIKKPLLIISILVAMRYGVFAVALTLPINTCIDLFLTGYYSGKLFNYSVWEQLKDSLPAVILSMAMFICVKLIGLLSIPAFPLLILQCLCGMVVYVVLSVITRNKEFSYLWQMIRRRFLHKET